MSSVCTGCCATFSRFKQLRAHWEHSGCGGENDKEENSLGVTTRSKTRWNDIVGNDSDSDSESSGSSINIESDDDEDDEVPSLPQPGGKRIDPMCNPWLNDCLELAKNEHEKNDPRDKLLCTLVDIVEQLAERVQKLTQVTLKESSVAPWVTVPTRNKAVKNRNIPTERHPSTAETVQGIRCDSISAELCTALGKAPSAAPSSTPSVAPSAVPPSNQRSTASQSSNRKRPQVVINNHPESDRLTVPGNRSFAGAVKDGKNVALFSDSICNRMSKNELKRKLECTVNKKSFPGATTTDLYEHYMQPTLKRNTPDTAIIHIGANDILTKGTSDGGLTAASIEKIASDIIKCGDTCRQAGVNQVCISSILPFKGRRAISTINHINSQLAALCIDRSYDFLLNDNITMDSNLFYTDGLHLNDAGRDILIDNFRGYILKR